ncbi:MAG: hypothetical protein GQ477_01860 [Nanohaloarchaea archaeon]|nr:hypothetical protein [Candidatus Nanohaloarchaea archaeon]
MRQGRIDLAMAIAIILAIVLIAFIGKAVFTVFDSGEDEADGMFESLKCQPKIAQACMDGKISETDTIDGICITDANKDTICDDT